jgi:hypothetical protein
VNHSDIEASFAAKDLSGTLTGLLGSRFGWRALGCHPRWMALIFHCESYPCDGVLLAWRNGTIISLLDAVGLQRQPKTEPPGGGIVSHLPAMTGSSAAGS